MISYERHGGSIHLQLIVRHLVQVNCTSCCFITCISKISEYAFVSDSNCLWMISYDIFFNITKVFSQPISLIMSLSPCCNLRFLPQRPFYTRMHIDRNKYAYIYFHVDECFQSSLLFLPTPFSLTQSAFLLDMGIFHSWESKHNIVRNLHQLYNSWDVFKKYISSNVYGGPHQRNFYCTKGLFIHLSLYHFEININNNDPELYFVNIHKEWVGKIENRLE